MGMAKAPNRRSGRPPSPLGDIATEAHALAGLGPMCGALITEYSSSHPQLLSSGEFRVLGPVAEALYTWDKDGGRDAEAATLIRAILDRIESKPIDVSSLRGWILSHPNDGAAVIECMNTLPPVGMKIIRMLSRKGSQKVVFLATWQLGLRQVVLKRFLGSETDVVRIQARESQTHPLTMPCKNIANTYSAQNSEGETFLVEELLPVILSDQWRTQGLAEAANLLYDVVCALSCLHSQLNLVHGDVKPDNIGKDGSRYVLLDFGICRPAVEFSGDVTGTGSLRTRAPELLGSDAYSANPEVVKKVDIWALGATVFNAVAGRFPLLEPGEYVPRLDEADLRRAFEQTLRDRAATEWDRRVDLSSIFEPLRSVLLPALHRDPTARPTAKELMELTERELAAYLRDNGAASDKGRFSPVEELEQYRDHLLRDSDALLYMPQGVRDQLKENLVRLKALQGFDGEQHSEIDTLINQLG
jgi:serine/threonine protein kinase